MVPFISVPPEAASIGSTEKKSNLQLAQILMLTIATIWISPPKVIWQSVTTMVFSFIIHRPRRSR